MLERIVIAGVGLIGGSLALALRRGQLARRLVGYGRDPERLRQAQALGVVDEISTDLATAVADADMVVLAVPVRSYAALLRPLKGRWPARTILTDVGSSKQAVVDAVAQALGRLPSRFVPGHPIAGREHSGFEHASADLFVAHKVILTPLPDVDPQAVRVVADLWQAVGAQVVQMAPSRHDRVLAATSHLPHLLAYTLVDALAGMPEEDDIFSFAAGGFRDFSRIASSDPVMWRDICLTNQTQILAMLDRFQDHLDAVRAAVTRGDGSVLEKTFRLAQETRNRHVARPSGQDDE